MASPRYPMTLPYFSYSSLRQFYSCKYCFKEKYINKKTPDVVNPYMEMGKRYHAETHKYHTGKQYDELIAPYTAKYAPDYRIHSEVQFLVPLVYRDKELPIRLFGYIDGITKDGICDLKYGNSNPNGNYEMQIILYSQVYYQKHKKYPAFALNWVNRKTNKIKNLVHQTDKQAYERLVEEKILPFFEAVEHPETIKITPGTYGTHLFSSCPFS